MSLQLLLDAIVADDRLEAKARLRADTGIASALTLKPKLYQEGVFHWLYAGDTALHLAAAGHRVEIVELLLKAGADPNAAGNHRRSTPLHYAADGYQLNPAWDPGRQVKTIERLVAAGSRVEAQDKNGATALHRAVRNRCSLAAQTLVDLGADPEARNHSGSTPFHLAVQNTGRGGSGDNRAIAEQRALIELFLRLDVSTRLKDGKGKTVLQWARSQWIQALLDGNCESGG